MEFIMYNNLEVGERIRTIRKSLHMSREIFSEMIDISDVFLGQLERGERSLSTKTLIKLVNFTGYSSDFILFGDESSNNTISKINRILNKCSDDTLDYFYSLMNNSFRFLKNSNS